MKNDHSGNSWLLVERRSRAAHTKSKAWRWQIMFSESWGACLGSCLSEGVEVDCWHPQAALGSPQATVHVCSNIWASFQLKAWEFTLNMERCLACSRSSFLIRSVVCHVLCNCCVRQLYASTIINLPKGRWLFLSGLCIRPSTEGVMCITAVVPREAPICPRSHS